MWDRTLPITHCCQRWLRARASTPPALTPPHLWKHIPQQRSQHVCILADFRLSTWLFPCTHSLLNNTGHRRRSTKRIFKKVVSALRNSLCLPANTERLWSAAEAWYLSSHLDCDVACPNLFPLRVRRDMVKVKGTLRVKSEGILDPLWCLTKTHIKRLWALLSETVSITVILKDPVWSSLRRHVVLRQCDSKFLRQPITWICSGLPSFMLVSQVLSKRCENKLRGAI